MSDPQIPTGECATGSMQDAASDSRSGPSSRAGEFVNRIRGQFPILATKMNGKPLIYLDNAATTQKPQAVIDAIVHYYTHDNANIHRGLYELSQRATDVFESARRKVASLLGAASAEECIFVRGTTEGINLVASSWGQANLKTGDEVVIGGLEHHSNIVPWQMACERSGAQLKVLYPNDDGVLDLDSLSALLTSRTKMLAIQHVSNALGTVHDIAAMTRRAKAVGAVVLVDGAQWVGHYTTDVGALGCDFYVFSAHKLYGPTGIGVLWGRKELLEAMPPYQGGGDMIETVSFEATTFAPLPNRFEAGTPDIAGAVGLGAAVDFVQSIGFDMIARQERDLLVYATNRLDQIQGLRILGRSEPKAAVISFVLEEPPIAPIDVAAALDREGIAIRTGHHCCMPLMGQMNVPGTCRVSLAMYNTCDEVDILVDVLNRLVANRASRRVSRRDRTTGQDKTIRFGAAVAETVEKSAGKLVEEFLEFDDRESKTELVMELGKALPDHFAVLKTLGAPVQGCMSEVYLVGRSVPDAPDRFEFVADSNAEIVRGLIAVLQQIFSGQLASEILQYDIQQFFRQIGLEQFISTQRRSGLDGMIRRIRSLTHTILDD